MSFIRSVTWPQYSGVMAIFLVVRMASGWAAEDVQAGAWFRFALHVVGGFSIGLGCAVLVVRDRERQREDA